MFSNKIANIQIMYNYHIPSGNFGKLYGNFNAIGCGGLLKTKNNWVVSAELNYLFGKEIKELSLLDNLTTSGGYLSSVGGAPGNYLVNMRGISSFVRAGRVLAWNKRNMNSGILIKGGIGIIQHHINLQAQESDIPQIDLNYSKGYDRYSTGIAFNEFIGYSYQSSNRLINFYIGVDLMQAQTQNRRGYNYDKMAYDLGKKNDFSTSFRFGWMIPIYLNTKEENEFQFR
ncbi:MAG: hypothetical protein CFE21_14300 [Bacteroidetes bacterium B1(2017)]|nr:MAG: hypothetical protein CFE21_14300 [Bacteroidetes bacterium B1(2017)]